MSSTTPTVSQSSRTPPRSCTRSTTCSADLDPAYLTTLRAKGRLQIYPSRPKDPDTGSVGIGATAALWAAVAHRYTRSDFPDTPQRDISSASSGTPSSTKAHLIVSLAAIPMAEA